MKRLYFIAATDDNGESADLFVAALSAPDAIGAWYAYYEMEDDGKWPDRVFEVPSLAPLNLDDKTPALALGWHTDIKQVAGAMDGYED